MNKSILSFMCVGLCAVACAEETAFVGQTMGAIPIVSDSPSLIVSVAFNELAPVDGTEITAANLVSTKNLPDNTTINIYKNGKYSTWTKSGNSWTGPSAAFTLQSNGGQSNDVVPQASAVGSAIGEGFWLIRPSISKDDSGNTLPFYLYGAVVSTPKTTIKAGVKNLVGNPLNLNQEATPTFANAVKGDKIGIITPAGGLAERDYDGARWVKRTGPFETEPVTLAIPKGTGFWYNSIGNQDIEVTWN